LQAQACASILYEEFSGTSAAAAVTYAQHLKDKAAAAQERATRYLYLRTVLHDALLLPHSDTHDEGIGGNVANITVETTPDVTVVTAETDILASCRRRRVLEKGSSLREEADTCHFLELPALLADIDLKHVRYVCMYV
jgi:hypothetical protein